MPSVPDLNFPIPKPTSVNFYCLKRDSPNTPMSPETQAAIHELVDAMVASRRVKDGDA